MTPRAHALEEAAAGVAFAIVMAELFATFCWKLP